MDQSGDIGKLYAFEHDKLVRVQSLLNDSFTRVRGIMQKYSDPAFKVIVAELGQEFTNFQQAIVQTLNAAMPQNQMDPFQQLAALQAEREQGYTKLNALNDEIQRLTDQKQGANRLIEELQSQLKNNRSGSTLTATEQNGSNDNDDPPYTDPLHFDDPHDTIDQLTNELETAQMSVGQSRRVVDELRSQNKRLSVEVLQLRDQLNQSYMPNLNATNLFNNGSHANAQMQTQSEIQGLNSVIEQLRIENGSLKEEIKLQTAKTEDLKRKLEARGGQTKHLFRTDTVTEWNSNDLDQLKAEMNKQKLALMMNRQMYVGGNEENAAAQLNMNSINEENDYATGDVNANGNNLIPKERGVYRSNTNTEWDQSELEKLKNELMAHLHEENKKAISQQLEKQMRFPEDKAPTNLLIGGDSGDMTVDDLKKRQEEMKAALAEQNRKIIMEKTEKAFALRESAVNQGMLQLEELDEAKKQLMEMQQIDAKAKLKKQLERQDQFIAPVAEPTDEQYSQLDTFLKNVLGVLNENIRERTVNELKSLFLEKANASSSNLTGNNTNNASSNGTSTNTNNNLSSNTPHGGSNQNNAYQSNALLDDDQVDDIGVLYPTPGGPTPGGPTPGGDDMLDETPGGPNDTGVEIGVGTGGLLATGDTGPSQEQWSKISEEQDKRINELRSELSSKTNEINELKLTIGTLESEIGSLREENRIAIEKSKNVNRNNEYSNYNRDDRDGDGRLNIDNSQTKKEMKELQIQIDDLKVAKLQLIRSTSKEMNHLRNMIKDMQKRINGEM